MRRIIASLLAAVAVAAVFALACGCAAAGYTVFPATQCFSSDILFSAKIIGGRADYAHKRMKETIAEIDRQVSATRPNSDVSRFNAASANTRVEVGAHTYALFELSREYGALTDGAFNCAAAPLSALWGIDAQSLYNGNTRGLPTYDDVRETLEYCDVDLVVADAERGRYYLTKADERVKLDFGGIAKGYAVDRCTDILREYDVSSALIDISGNAYFYGRYIDNGKSSDWKVGIVSPRPRGGETLARGYVCAVSLYGGVSAATAGDYMRFYKHEGEDCQALYIAHIINKDGAPVGIEYADGKWAASDEWVISATVIGESSAKCDALSTAVCVLGMERGAQLLQKVGYKGLIFTEKRFTIIGDTRLYKPDVYDGFRDYERYEP